MQVASALPTERGGLVLRSDVPVRERAVEDGVFGILAPDKVNMKGAGRLWWSWSYLQGLLGVWGVTTLLVGAVGWLTWQTLEAMEAAGSLALRANMARDLMADVLPHPAYLTEAFAVALQSAAQADDIHGDQAIKQLQHLREAFDERSAFWLARLPEGPLRESFVRASESGQVFGRILESEVVPLLQGERKHEARQRVVAALTVGYLRHRAAVDEVVQQARSASLELDRERTVNLTAIRRRLDLLFAGSVLSLMLAAIWSSWLLARRTKALETSLNTERTARKEVAKLARVVEHSQDGIIITDRRGIIEYVNPAFTTITGYSSEEAIGKTPGELLKSGKQDQAFYQLLWERILTGQTFTGTLINRKRSGELYVASEAIAPVKEEDGTISHFISIQRDITEQQRLEAKLNQASKLEAVGQLVGGIAHDFNNQLVPILGFVELLKPFLHESEQAQSYCEGIRKAAEHAAALTRQLLTFSRHRVVNRQIVDVNHVLTECQILLKRVIGEQIDLQVLQSRQASCIKVDPTELETVLLNLAVNARDAMPDGGRLIVEATNVQLDTAYVAVHPGAIPGPYVRLAVTDSGCGIPPELMGRLFEPFFTTKPPGKGTGLGLALVKEMVTQAGGFVEVYSEVGQGTTVKLYLPRYEVATQEDLRPRSDAALPRGAETVLVVEDHTESREFIVTVLTELGYTVLVAADGQEALDVAHAHQGSIDALITDLVLPKLNGRELAQVLRKAQPTLKVLFTSGYAGQSLAIGACEGTFLAKPYTARDLATRLRQVLDSH